MYCSQCRTQNLDDAKFCISCGADLTRQKTPPEAKAGSIGDEKTTDEFVEELGHYDVGDIIAYRYEVLEFIGKGGMGEVYKVQDKKLKDILALKLMSEKLMDSERAIERFRQELKTTRELRHPNIVKTYEFGEHEGREYFTMEYVEGKTLREIMDERKTPPSPPAGEGFQISPSPHRGEGQGEGFFTLNESLSIINQICDALSYAHKFTVHRDIKPENILIHASDYSIFTNDFSIKLTDFGIAKVMSKEQFTATSMRLGTPYYMAPEQLTDAGSADERADIFSVGVILYEMLTGEVPVGDFDPVSEINKEVPKSIDGIVKKSLRRKIEDRFKDISSVQDALKKIRDEAESEKKGAEEEKRRKEETRLKAEAEKRMREDEERHRIEDAKREEEKKKIAEAERKRQQEEVRLKAEREEKERQEKEERERRKREEAERRTEERAREFEEQKKRAEEVEGKKRRNIGIFFGVGALILILVFALWPRQEAPQIPSLGEPPALQTPMPETPAPVQEPQKQTEVVPETKPMKPIKNAPAGMKMIFIRGGCYGMGDNFGDGGADEKPVHDVCVDDFYLGETEVTQAQWEAIMGNNPSSFKGADRPMENVSWNDVQEFLRKLNGKTGSNYRLPTEAEWEYAAREGGKIVKYGTGKNEITHSNAKYDSGDGTVSVKSYNPNALGLYDMSGNVWEWCKDWYDNNYYSSSPKNNPEGPGSGSVRVLRGGSWGSKPGYIRASYRFRNVPDFGNLFNGFRLAQ